jgi:hypothetical protein
VDPRLVIQFVCKDRLYFVVSQQIGQLLSNYETIIIRQVGGPLDSPIVNKHTGCCYSRLRGYVVQGLHNSCMRLARRKRSNRSVTQRRLLKEFLYFPNLFIRKHMKSII